jgi:hypothetical protein
MQADGLGRVILSGEDMIPVGGRVQGRPNAAMGIPAMVCITLCCVRWPQALQRLLSWTPELAEWGTSTQLHRL